MDVLDHTNVKLFYNLTNNYTFILKLSYNFVMATQRPSENKIDQFKRDVALMGISHGSIAEGMGMSKSNFSRYFNERIPITNGFLNKFYNAWGTELKKKAKELKSGYSTLSTKENTAAEPDLVYSEADIRDELIDSLDRNNKALIRNLDKMVNGQITLINSNHKLATNNEKLVNAHLARFERSIKDDDGKAENADK